MHLHPSLFISQSLAAALRPALVLLSLICGSALAAPAVETKAELARQRASAEVRQVVDWVVATRDNQDSPFVIVDKKQARVFVFEPGGRLSGVSPALMGSARGDHSVPGIGEREMSGILPEERTTPAGRYVAEPGQNFHGEDIIWVDYDAAVSLHRVRANNPQEKRLERLASATPADNRISYGCINVPRAFYDQVVSPAFAGARGIVYVLPEVRRLAEVFGSLRPTSYSKR